MVNSLNYFYHYPFAPIQGNHDDPGNSDIFQDHFNVNSESFDSQGSTYTYLYGDAQFFAINSEWYEDTAIYIPAVSNWMRTQVYANPNIKWRIVYYNKNIFNQNIKLFFTYLKISNFAKYFIIKNNLKP